MEWRRQAPLLVDRTPWVVASEASSAGGSMEFASSTLRRPEGWVVFRGGVDRVTVLRKQVHVNLYTVRRPQVYTTLERHPPSATVWN